MTKPKTKNELLLKMKQAMSFIERDNWPVVRMILKEILEEVELRVGGE